MLNKDKNNEEILRSFDQDIKKDLDTDKIKNDIKNMEKQIGNEMPKENKKILTKNRFRDILKANKTDKEFVELMWNRNKKWILKEVS